MGLSGRKVKQRIPKDPRNLSWADDAARFGSNYLSKFGWDSSKGLGAAGDGMTSHIKVSHKLDMLGIGANHQKDPNGIAWKQNRDFENLLKRLNDNLAEEDAGNLEEERVISEDEEPASGRTKEKKKKRKHQDVGEDAELRKKKKKKESKAENVEESCSNPGNPEESGSITVQAVEIIEEVSVDIKRPIVPRHRAHRARAIAAKNIASKSAAHISEILGVAPDISTITTTTSQAKLTSVTDTDALGLDKITTSNKTVADYFKDKLLARSKLTDSTSTFPPPHRATSNEEESYEAPRMGLGAGASHFRMDIRSTQTQIEEETQRLGMSKFSSLMSASFLASASSLSFVSPSQGDIDRDEGSAHISEVESEPPKERKKKKKTKDRSKKVEEEEEEEDLESAGVDEKKKRKQDKKDKKAKGTETMPEEKGVGETVEESTSKKHKKDRSERSEEVKFVKEDENESRKKEKRKSKGSGSEKEKRKDKDIR